MNNQDTRALQKIESGDRQDSGRGQLVWIPPGYELSTEPQGQPPESHLWDYIWLVWRGRWLISFVFLFCVGVAALQVLRATPIYMASAKLQIGSQSPRIVDLGRTDRDNSSEFGDSIDTQIQFIRSKTLARKVVEELNLYAPSSGGKTANSVTPPAPSSLKTYLKSFDRKRDTSKANPQTPKNAADAQIAYRVGGFLSCLSIAKIPDTEIVQIGFMDPDPSVCARVANAVCDAYMALNYQTKTNSYEYASKWIDQKLYDVKANLEKSEEELYTVGGGSDALALAENAEKFSSKLEEMNMSLAAAEREVHDKEFQLNSVRKGARPEDFPASSTQPSARMYELRTELEKCEVEYDKALQEFGPQMAQVKTLKAAKTRLESQIAKESRRSAGLTAAAAQYAYDQAKSNRDFLKDSYEKQKEHMLNIQQRLVKFNILKREVEVNKDIYNSLLQRSREVGVTSGLKAGNVSIVETAEPPRSPALPNKRRTIALGAFLGLLLGLGLVFFREYMDTTVRGTLDVQLCGKMATLGLLPHVDSREKGARICPELISAKEPRSLFAESIRHLRTSLQYSSAGHPPKVIMVTSAMPSEGKTTVSTNLAIALAQSGRRTILIDADLKKPSIHKFFDVSRDHGLSDILTGKTRGNIGVHLLKTETDNLYVIPSGTRPPNPVDLLDSVVMRRLLSSLSEHFDNVILDCPPTLDLADTGVLFRHVDGVVVVVKPGKTPRMALRRINEQVQGLGGRLLGVVLNDRKVRSSQRYGYGYGYGNGYGYNYGAYREEVAAIEQSG